MVDTTKLRALLAAATPGPWQVSIWEDRDDGGFCAAGPHHTCEDADDPDEAAHDAAYADAVFIAHARTDIPALVAEVERLRARKAELCPCVRRYETPGCDECGGVGAVMVEGAE